MGSLILLPMADVAPQALFDQASELLAQNKFSEALPLLQQIEKAGVTSDAFEANYGRALVEHGQTGDGIAHLTRAVALDRWDSAHRQNLRVAQRRVGAGAGQTMSHPSEWGNALASYLRPSEALWCASLMIILFAALRLLRGPLGRRLTTLIFAMAFLLAGSAALGRWGRSVAVLTHASELRGAPLASASALQKLEVGTRLRVIQVREPFAEVERPNAFRGWIDASALAHSPF